MRKLALSDEILLQVEKPARYIGNEVNAVMKNKEDIDVRFCTICLTRKITFGAKEYILPGRIWLRS